MNLVRYPCGCVNQMSPQWGMLKSFEKCKHHRGQSGRGGRDYYQQMGCLADEPQHVAELIQAIPGMWSLSGNGKSLEIGCGASAYARWIMRCGYQYIGIDTDPFAVDWTASKNPGAITQQIRFEEFKTDEQFRLIIAAHCVEHFEDAPAMVERAIEMLADGGRLVLIVPDDSDPVNPDHLWFFTPGSMAGMLTKLGMTDLQLAVRQRVPYEKFIYCQSWKTPCAAS